MKAFFTDKDTRKYPPLKIVMFVVTDDVWATLSRKFVFIFRVFFSVLFHRCFLQAVEYAFNCNLLLGKIVYHQTVHLYNFEKATFPTTTTTK